MRQLPATRRFLSAFTRWSRLDRLRDWIADIARAAGARHSHVVRPTPARLAVLALEDRVVPTRPYPIPVIYAGVGTGPPPLVRAFDVDTGNLNFEKLVAEPAFTGGVRVATADVNQDGFPDLVAAMGEGGGPRVRVFDGRTGEPFPGVLGSFFAYDPSFTGGVNVAAADVDGDGYPDVITAAGAGGSAHVKVFSGADGSVLASFIAFDPVFRGGATVAAADFDGDGKAELVVGAGPGGGPHVKVFDLATGNVLRSFYAFDPSFEGGVAVGADQLTGDVNGDGHPDLVVGTGAGVASRVKVFSGADHSVLADFAPYAAGMTAGVMVALAYVDNDDRADIVVATGPGVESTIRVFSGATGKLVTGPSAEFLPFGAGAYGGVSVAASNDPSQFTLTALTGTDGGIDGSYPGDRVVAAGQPLSLTAQVTPGGPSKSTITPTGTVTFRLVSSTGPVIGTAPLYEVSTGVAAADLVTANLPAAPLTSNVYLDYSGDAVYAGSSAISSVAVTVQAPDAGSPLPAAPYCPSCCADPLAAPAGAGVGTGAASAAGVDGNGLVRLARTDLVSGGYGEAWSRGWSWSNAGGYSDAVSGSGGRGTDLPVLARVNGDSGVAVVAGCGTGHFFDLYGGAYHERNGGAGGLRQDASSHEFVLDDGTGSVFTFYDFSGSTPSGRAGTLKSVSDPAGGLTEVTSWDGAGRPTEVQRVSGTGGSALTESFLTTYISSGANAGLVDTVTQRTKVGSGSWATVRSVASTYYTSSNTYGKAGDLMRAEVKDAAGTTLDTTYYRYYTSGGSGGGSGSRDLVKFAFGPAAYARLTAALGTGVDALSDAQVDDYADTALAYDATDKATQVVAAAGGCSVCSGGLGTFDYTYTANSGFGGLRDPNEWALKQVETLPDGNTNTRYVNADGQVMLRVYTDTSTSQQWLSYTRYDAAGRVVLSAEPSAVTGFSESYPDLVGYSGGNAAYLSDSAGLLTAYTYASATTATSSTAGDAAGYIKEVDLLHGETGTPVPQSTQTYITRTAGGVDHYVPASSTAYRNDNGTGGQTTTAAYTWQGSTAQPASVTTTMPTVTTAQNGPNSSTAVSSVMDAFGRVIWSKDAGGFLSYTEYDTVTGAVTKSISDVDTTQTATFANLPSGWTTPSGGGLHLTTAYEVDALGRTTKTTAPNGRIDYAVYNDAGHEVRTYAGWNTSTNTPSGPTVVTRQDRANSYTETLTMSATPAVSSGRPTGAESVSAVQSLSRSYTNAVGQAVTSDTYFDLGGITYSTAVGLGTSGTNYYRKQQAYNTQGRPNKTVSPQGTITRTEYDGQNRPVSEWVGTDDTPTTGYWSVTNLTGTDMVKVREYEYDGGGIGDGNLTKVTDKPGLGAADRVTQTWYDWRNRAVATKSGVEGSESTAVNRPIVYRDYDNLGEVTLTRVYDGDTVGITTTSGVPVAPSSSLLRAQSGASYDELGRAYRTETYSVDPSSGSVGSYTLKSDTWFDARGQVIKTASPGGLVQKTSYDGVGRTTVSYTTDGGGDSGYGDADDVSGDAVLEQAEYAYDGDGNMLSTTVRQRFHDETGTGALGTPSSGVLARVSYVGSYYDAGDRMTASVDVGTNGGTSWTRPGSVPSRSDTVLVTSYVFAADAVQVVRLTGSPTGGTFTLTFGGQTTSALAYNASAATVQTAVQALTSVGSGNAVVTCVAGAWQVRFAGTLAGAFQARMTASGAGLTGGSSPAVAVSTVSAGGDAGRAAAVTDPRGLVNRTYADALGRTTQTVENFVDGEVSDADDKTTEYAYNAAGMTSLTAKLTGGGGQTTQWVYGVTTGGGSAITSNDTVGATHWPDPTTGAASGSEQETVTVNALGQTVTATDRNGTVHTLGYDVLGRVVSDVVTTLGSGVDGGVRRVETAYDGQGNAYLVTTYDATTSGSIVTQVQRAFNGLGQMTTEWQARGGAVNTSTSPKVQYAYSEMPSGANHSRLTSVTYPSGYVLTYNYASGLNSTISRLSSLSDASGTVEEYDYLGMGTVVRRGHPQPGVDLTFLKQGMESNGDAGDKYAGLDRFGRVVDQRWIATGSGTALDRFQYGYDRDGNRLFRDNLVNTAFGELYTYDGFNQLASSARGTLNGGRTAISGSPTRTQAWDYDALGNWDSVTTNGTAQTRGANAQNEITSVSGATTPTYDANGNMTTDEAGLKFVYDAWNRLVAVKNSAGTTTLKTYGYDGLNRRVSETASGTTTDLYYSAAWQVLEERVSGSTTKRYVWSPAYVDAMILRDRDTDANGSLDERMWVQQDANWNVTALLNNSGAVVERYVYDAFGAMILMNASWTAIGSSIYGWMHSYQGARLDAITGNYHFRRRDYSPTLGRWASLDPVRFQAGDVNLYRFVGNRTPIFVDPSGERWAPTLITALGTVVPFGNRYNIINGRRYRAQVNGMYQDYWHEAPGYIPTPLNPNGKWDLPRADNQLQKQGDPLVTPFPHTWRWFIWIDDDPDPPGGFNIGALATAFGVAAGWFWTAGILGGVGVSIAGGATGAGVASAPGIGGVVAPITWGGTGRGLAATISGIGVIASPSDSPASSPSGGPGIGGGAGSGGRGGTSVGGGGLSGGFIDRPNFGWSELVAERFLELGNDK